MSRDHRKQDGSALLDACAALALSAAAAAAVLSGAKPLSCAVHVGTARTALVSALIEARREAYASESAVLVEARADEHTVTLQPGNRSRPLGEARLSVVPADGNVQFRASGLADNATLELACGESTATVVVNQRGVIR